MNPCIHLNETSDRRKPEEVSPGVLILKKRRENLEGVGARRRSHASTTSGPVRLPWLWRHIYQITRFPGPVQLSSAQHVRDAFTSGRDSSLHVGRFCSGLFCPSIEPDGRWSSCFGFCQADVGQNVLLQVSNSRLVLAHVILMSSVKWMLQCTLNKKIKTIKRDVQSLNFHCFIVPGLGVCCSATTWTEMGWSVRGPFTSGLISKAVEPESHRTRRAVNLTEAEAISVDHRVTVKPMNKTWTCFFHTFILFIAHGHEHVTRFNFKQTSFS